MSSFPSCLVPCPGVIRAEGHQPGAKSLIKEVVGGVDFGLVGLQVKVSLPDELSALSRN